MALNKVVSSLDEALAGLTPGMTLTVGGFGICGNPFVLIEAIAERNIGNLTVYSNNPGSHPERGALGLAQLVERKLVSRFGGSHNSFNKEFERQYLAGEIEVELIPQGTLAERMRAGGAGIPGFYTATGTSTFVADGGLPQRFDGAGGVVRSSEPKETRELEFKGRVRQYVFEPAITSDFGLIRAHTVDEAGNCVFRNTAQNFNLEAGMCADITVVEAEHLVPVGAIDPNDIHLPGIFVDRIVPLTPEQAAHKPIEIVHTRPTAGGDDAVAHAAHHEPLVRECGKGWTRNGIAARAARELHDGDYVNLGVGIPTLVANHVPSDVSITLQGENGILNIGPSPTAAEVDADLINASKATITLLPGSATFSSSMSFAMIRGGKINAVILGSLQVAENGDIANWGIPGRKMNGMGGAMDLVNGVDHVIALMEQRSTKHAEPKLLHRCTYPLTGSGCVKRVITDLGVYDITDEGFLLVELAPGVTVEDVAAASECTIHVSPDLVTHEA
ncbi:succinyl-CoA--3-ketoacid-CoA transferase [Corynebacterium sp. 13CS0277]|uniref:3-oxoacid CoA-transferase n=1 Tax=Corynebacterium sp. 13CS0277 TaxID=2071994 RepID=UPI000D02611E|nr:3-oxoacid CoA-transferase [Corynebacterium sp. 13CS0277]PRQ11644.1 succinyl-CoA--3-ketoacid-CoA transferase [Corynebacterium sp. 13CS0277]